MPANLTCRDNGADGILAHVFLDQPQLHHAWRHVRWLRLLEVRQVAPQPDLPFLPCASARHMQS
jgi:hypothetical protein